MMFDWVVALVTLSALEIVLGIDNIVVISIAVEKLPESQRAKARKLGLALALIARLILLSMIAWLSKLSATLFTLMGNDFSIRDLVLIAGGLFLMAKATTEIYNLVEAKHHEKDAPQGTTYSSVLTQIIIFDLIFSLDSVLTAVGLAEQLSVMVTAVVLAMIVMMIFADAIGSFVLNNPAIKLLALAFLVLIGVLLVAEGFDSHLNRGYVYFAMVFSLGIELLNRRRRVKAA